MKKFVKIVLLLFVITLTGCNKAKPITEEEGFDYGSVTDGKYSNAFFDIQMTIPDGWFVQDQSQREESMKRGGEIISKNDDKAKAALKTAEITTANLLGVTKYEQGTFNGFNPNFVLIAENMKFFPAIKSGKDYLANSRNVLLGTKLDITHLDETFEKKTINGMDFYVMGLTANMSGKVVMQKYLATVKDGFALLFIYSYNDTEQMTEIESDVLQSIAPFKSKSL